MLDLAGALSEASQSRAYEASRLQSRLTTDASGSSSDDSEPLALSSSTAMTILRPGFGRAGEEDNQRPNLSMRRGPSTARPKSAPATRPSPCRRSLDVHGCRRWPLALNVPSTTAQGIAARGVLLKSRQQRACLVKLYGLRSRLSQPAPVHSKKPESER